MKITLHQTGPTDIPKVYQDCSETWKTNNFDYKFYTDDDLDNLIKDNMPEKYDFYLNMRKIEKIDFSRYLMMYLDGGIYADMDTILKNENFVIDIFKKNNNKVIVGIEFNKLRYHAAQSILISTSKNNKMWLDLIDYIYDIYDESNYITYNTGPEMFTSFLKRNQNKYDVIYEENLLKTNVKHVKTGNWRVPSFKMLNKNCLICQKSPFMCECYNHKWYITDNQFYYNIKIYILVSLILFFFLIGKFFVW